VGVVGRGKSCFGKKSPGIYTRVKKYLNWIKNFTEKNGRCYNKNDKGKSHEHVDKEGNWVDG
jgi:secreted trypsin-like serine protease